MDSGWQSLSLARRKELTGQCARAIVRAVLTLDALPDRDRRFLRTNLRSSMPTPVRDWLAYRIDEFEAPSRNTRFRPTPADISNMLTAMGWLAWLKRETADGDRDVAILMARAHEVPWSLLSLRFGRSDDTMRRWLNASVAKIAARFWREVAGLK